MPDTIRIASFNVENLFARPKVFNFRKKEEGDAILKRIDAFQKTLRKSSYSAADKNKLVKEYTEGDAANKKPPLKNYIKILEDRGKLWKKQGYTVVGVRASGRNDWDGTIEFKKAKFSDVGRENTAKVIKKVKADIACIVEADNRLGLKSFDANLLHYRYPYEMLLDGNDLRGIDVGIYSKFPLGGVWTHMFDRGSNNKSIFSRDCPEYEIILPNDERVYVLCNHLKSKGYGSQAANDARRKKQARAIADILSDYDLGVDNVVVAGDLNDVPGSDPLSPLLGISNLYDVLELEFGNDSSKRWTYHYNDFEQIDYLLVSKPLKDRFKTARVERRGMYNLKNLTEGEPAIETEEQFDTVTNWTNAASDHGAVWADFDF